MLAAAGAGAAIATVAKAASRARCYDRGALQRVTFTSGKVTLIYMVSAG
jgi:hypothetical protein